MAKPPKLNSRAIATFRRLDRNRDGKLGLNELVGGKHAPKVRGHITGDRNRDGGVSVPEFQRLIGRVDWFDKGPRRALRSAAPQQAVFKMPPGASATFRTHASGLVMGRVNPGDTFVTSHTKGSWVFGHVKGHPERRGWVLRESLPKKPTREPNADDLRDSAKGATDYRKKAGIVYTNGLDKKVLQLLQKGLVILKSAAIGYTTPVRPRDPARPIAVYANYPCTEANRLMRDGKPVEIPAGEDVKFRYTPDGKNAVVFVGRRRNLSKLWGIVPLDKLDIPRGTIGAQTPAHPILHR